MDAIVTVDGSNGTVATEGRNLRPVTGDTRSRATRPGAQYDPGADSTGRQPPNERAARQHR